MAREEERLKLHVAGTKPLTTLERPYVFIHLISDLRNRYRAARHSEMQVGRRPASRSHVLKACQR